VSGQGWRLRGHWPAEGDLWPKRLADFTFGLGTQPRVRRAHVVWVDSRAVPCSGTLACLRPAGSLEARLAPDTVRPVVPQSGAADPAELGLLRALRVETETLRQLKNSLAPSVYNTDHAIQFKKRYWSALGRLLQRHVWAIDKRRRRALQNLAPGTASPLSEIRWYLGNGQLASR
jgi:hypothetical protein